MKQPKFVDNQRLVIKVEVGTELEITRRALCYMLQNSFRQSLQELLSITGFYKNCEFEIVEMINLNHEDNLTLRDDSGRPIWACDQ